MRHLLFLLALTALPARALAGPLDDDPACGPVSAEDRAIIGHQLDRLAGKIEGGPVLAVGILARRGIAAIPCWWGRAKAVRGAAFDADVDAAMKQRAYEGEPVTLWIARWRQDRDPRAFEGLLTHLWDHDMACLPRYRNCVSVAVVAPWIGDAATVLGEIGDRRALPALVERVRAWPTKPVPPDKDELGPREDRDPGPFLTAIRVLSGADAPASADAVAAWWQTRRAQFAAEEAWWTSNHARLWSKPPPGSQLE